MQLSHDVVANAFLQIKVNRGDLNRPGRCKEGVRDEQLSTPM